MEPEGSGNGTPASDRPSTHSDKSLSTPEDVETDTILKVPAPERPNEPPTAPLPWYRRWNGAIVGVWWLCSIILMDFVNTYGYERVPDEMPPLPDLGFENLPDLRGKVSVYPTDIVTITITVVAVLFAFRFSKKSQHLVRRLFCCYAILMNLRTVTIISTTLPTCYEHGPCREGKGPLGNRLVTTLSYAFALGFKVEGVVQCGDYIFSGHTTFLWLLTLHLFFVLPPWRSIRIFLILWTSMGSLCIIMWRNHYSIDVVLGVMMTVLVWNWYHGRAEVLELGRRPANFFDQVVEFVEGDKGADVSSRKDQYLLQRWDAQEDEDIENA